MLCANEVWMTGAGGLSYFWDLVVIVAFLLRGNELLAKTPVDLFGIIGPLGEPSRPDAGIGLARNLPGTAIEGRGFPLPFLAEDLGKVFILLLFDAFNEL